MTITLVVWVVNTLFHGGLQLVRVLSIFIFFVFYFCFCLGKVISLKRQGELSCHVLFLPTLLQIALGHVALVMYGTTK